MPALSLSFDYGGTRIRVSDERQRFFSARGDGVVPVLRDSEGEARAQRLLEGFGAIELCCLEDCEPPFDSEADYVLPVGSSVHAICSFSAQALPRLRARGWHVEVDAEYPYQVVHEDVPWYASVVPDEGKPDWFGLELGVEVEGRKVNLLPALLDVLEECGDTEGLQSLLRLPARFRAVPAGPNRYLPVPPERLERVIRVLLELYRGETSEDSALRLTREQAGSLARLDDAVGGGELRWEGRADILDRGHVLARPFEGTAAAVDGVRATLRPYQQDGLGWLQHLRVEGVGGILADDMGLGKTLQTIAHLAAEKQAGRMDRPSLIVMPTSLVGNWTRELERFAPQLRVGALHGPKRQRRLRARSEYDVTLTTYQVLVRDLETFRQTPLHYLILDEAQAVKNRRSLARRAVSSLEARHRLCLTGTPVENNLEELWSLFDFLMPGFLGDARLFQSRFRTPIETDGDEIRLQALRSAVGPFILRRMKEQVVRDLPPKTELVCPVELEGDQRDLYESIRVAAHGDVRRAIRKKGLAASTIAILDALMKLRQVCCDPRLVGVPSARRVRGSAKYARFLELLSGQLERGRRVLVFSQFTQMLHLLGKGLAKRRIPFLELTGATTNRQRCIDAFEKGHADVFLISLKAGGIGLNLTSADTVVHYDPWWNAAAQAQATDRVYRIGQTRPVFVHNLIVAGSVEERILKLQQRKQHLADSILASGRDGGTRFSPAEIEDLFAPLD